MIKYMQPLNGSTVTQVILYCTVRYFIWLNISVVVQRRTQIIFTRNFECAIRRKVENSDFEVEGTSLQ